MSGSFYVVSHQDNLEDLEKNRFLGSTQQVLLEEVCVEVQESVFITSSLR